MRKSFLILAVIFALVIIAGPAMFGDDEDPLLPDDDKEKPDEAKPEAEDPLDDDTEDGEKPDPAEKKSGPPACKKCTERKMCDIHKDKEKEVLARLKGFRKKKWKKGAGEEKKRRGELDPLILEVAALTYEHPQYKSKAVAEALGGLLMKEKVEEVRITIFDLMDDRQHEGVCIKWLQKCMGTKDLNNEAMMVKILAAIAYFENEATVRFFQSYLDSGIIPVRDMAIDCIAYVDGHAAISALIGFLDTLVKTAFKSWGGEELIAPWERTKKHLINKTNHIPDVRAPSGQPKDQGRLEVKDWNDWWKKNARRYERTARSERERKAWKNRIKFKSPSRENWEEKIRDWIGGEDE